VSYQERAVNAFTAALPVGAKVRERSAVGPHRDVIVSVAGNDLRLRWLPVGWPRQVAGALGQNPPAQVLAAPLMSPGARKAASDAGVGWVDESGAAEIDLPNLIVAKTGDSRVPLDTRVGWRPATLAVCEALLGCGVPATVSSVVTATGFSMSTAATALKFLERQGLLDSAALRGRAAARRICDRDELLDAYAAASVRLRSAISMQVGVLWRNPVAGALEAGRLWTRADIVWAATSALSASVLAPMLTEIAPMEIYLPARAPGDLRRAAAAAGLPEIDGGRLALRPFPTPADTRLTTVLGGGLRSALWPRVYADLRTAGVRGEDAAEHLRQEMTT
jgi:hypothetical protein